MATFTNFATLSYNGGTTNSNVVTGEILESLTATKTAITENYTAGDNLTYVVTLVNSGSTAFNGLTMTDDLGGYVFDAQTVYPLEYTVGSLRYYVNGVLQPTPTVTAGPPLTVTGINVPAASNAIIIYETAVTAFAPLATGSTVVNTIDFTGGGLSTTVTATETVTAADVVDLNIRKAINPVAVTENGQLTYTFTIENSGNVAAPATENIVLSDTFDPVLSAITVSLDGVALTEGVDYTYNETTGEFATVAGRITVPAATVTQNPDGSWTVTPGTSSLVITGTV